MKFIIISKPIWFLKIAVMIYDINNVFAFSGISHNAVSCSINVPFDGHFVKMFKLFSNNA